MKKALETGTESGDILFMILKEQGGYLIPCFVVFFAFYLINVIMLIYIIAKKKTPAPGLDVDPESSSFQDSDQWIWKTGNQCIL